MKAGAGVVLILKWCKRTGMVNDYIRSCGDIGVFHAVMNDDERCSSHFACGCVTSFGVFFFFRTFLCNCVCSVCMYLMYTCACVCMYVCVLCVSVILMGFTARRTEATAIKLLTRHHIHTHTQTVRPSFCVCARRSCGIGAGEGKGERKMYVRNSCVEYNYKTQARGQVSHLFPAPISFRLRAFYADMKTDSRSVARTTVRLLCECCRKAGWEERREGEGNCSVLSY